MNSSKIEMSYFAPPITNKVPSATMTPEEVAKLILSNELARETQTLRSIADKASARFYKTWNFPYVTPSGLFSYCCDADLVKHSELLCIDLDGVADVDGLKRLLIADRHLNTLMAFRSPSGNGLKWFIGIDLQQCDHSTWFHAVRNYLLVTYPVLTPKMVDQQCQNVSRACFLCHDPELYFNDNEEESASLPFNPLSWVPSATEAAKPKPITKCQTNSQPLHPLEELAKAKAVVRELLRRGANIAEGYDEYLKLGFALANGLGNDGRELYHMLCRQSAKYRENDCEQKWQHCMHKNDGRTTIATFYNMAKQAGVDLSSIARELKQESIYMY